MDTRLKQLQDYLKNDPQDPFLNFAIAKEYEILDQIDQAKAQYEMLVKTSPDYVGTYYHLAKLNEHLELNEEAIETYKAGIEVAKSQKDMHSMAELTTALANLQMEL